MTKLIARLLDWYDCWRQRGWYAPAGTCGYIERVEATAGTPIVRAHHPNGWTVEQPSAVHEHEFAVKDVLGGRTYQCACGAVYREQF